MQTEWQLLCMGDTFYFAKITIVSAKTEALFIYDINKTFIK